MIDLNQTYLGMDKNIIESLIKELTELNQLKGKINELERHNKDLLKENEILNKKNENLLEELTIKSTIISKIEDCLNYTKETKLEESCSTQTPNQWYEDRAASVVKEEMVDMFGGGGDDY